MLLAALAIPMGLDLFMPVPEANPLTPGKITLGRELFGISPDSYRILSR